MTMSGCGVPSPPGRTRRPNCLCWLTKHWTSCAWSYPRAGAATAPGTISITRIRPGASRKLTAVLAGLGAADRYSRQEALMPFRHLLPEHLRERNQRLGEE